jgi:hypothetical protein
MSAIWWADFTTISQPSQWQYPQKKPGDRYEGEARNLKK